MVTSNYTLTQQVLHLASCQESRESPWGSPFCGRSKYTETKAPILTSSLAMSCASGNENSLQQANTLQLDVESIKYFLNQLEELLVVLKDFGSNVVAHIHSAMEKINSLESDKSKLRDDLYDCKKKLSETQDKASLFKDRVHTLFSLVDMDETSIKNIKESLLRNDKTLLASHLETLTRYLMQCFEFYEDFQKVHQQTEKLCRKTTQECDSKKRKAKTRKNTARAAGLGGAAVGVGGVVGGGIALSVVAGFFTFGVGTVIGLAATSVAAAGTITAGVGTVGVAGVSSHLVARNFDQMQQTFEGICKDLEMVNDNVTDIGMKVSHLRILMLVPVNCDKKNVQEEIGNSVSTEQLCKSFDILQEGIKKLRCGNLTNILDN